MNNITQKKDKGRCVVCTRSKRDAIREQANNDKPCDIKACVFSKEIADAIKEKHTLKFTVKEPNKIEITLKTSPKIEIIKKK